MKRTYTSLAIALAGTLAGSVLVSCKPPAEGDGGSSTPPAEADAPAAPKGSGPAPSLDGDKPAETPAAEEGEKKAGEASATQEPAQAEAKESRPSADAAGDRLWPMWGRDASNNMVGNAENVPHDFTAGEVGDDGNVDPATAKHAKWVVKLGSQTYGTPTIAGGRVYVGTNNEEPRNEKILGDRGVVMAFDEASGDFLWQLTSHKLGAGKVSDWEFLGMCSSATIDGKFGYIITNRGEVLCFDTYGMSDGNDGPYTDEAKYLGGEGNEPMEPGDTDADIVWIYDMRNELGVFPHNVTSSSVVVTEDKVYATTSNGVDWTHLNIPAPQAPCLIALDKETGELVGEEGSGIGTRIMHCNWSSPAYATINDQPTVIFGAGDGWTYGFNPAAVKDEEGFDILPELWKVDCCPKEYRFDDAGEPIKYATYPGPSEIISSPVVYNGLVYAAIGQDPEHGEGVGALTCIDPSKGSGEEAIVWQFREIGRTISTPSIHDGLVYISDYSGRLFCVDAANGELIWEYDTLSHIWGSTTVVDGKVFLGNEDGELVIIKAGRDADTNGDGKITRLKKDSKTGEIRTPEETLNVVEFPAPIYSSVVVANDTIYVATQTHLYAYSGGE